MNDTRDVPDGMTLVLQPRGSFCGPPKRQWRWVELSDRSAWEPWFELSAFKRNQLLISCGPSADPNRKRDRHGYDYVVMAGEVAVAVLPKGALERISRGLVSNIVFDDTNLRANLSLHDEGQSNITPELADGLWKLAFVFFHTHSFYTERPDISRLGKGREAEVNEVIGRLKEYGALPPDATADCIVEVMASLVACLRPCLAGCGEPMIALMLTVVEIILDTLEANLRPDDLLAAQNLFGREYNFGELEALRNAAWKKVTEIARSVYSQEVQLYRRDWGPKDDHRVHIGSAYLGRDDTRTAAVALEPQITNLRGFGYFGETPDDVRLRIEQEHPTHANLVFDPKKVTVEELLEYVHENHRLVILPVSIQGSGHCSQCQSE